MIFFERAVTILIVLTISLFLQESRIFAVSGAVPNFFLIFSLLFIFIGKWGRHFLFSFPVFIVLSFLFFPFFIFPICGAYIISFLAFFLKKTLTGNAFYDFLISIFLGTPFFYFFSQLLVNIFRHGLLFGSFGFSFGPPLFYEVGYNIIVGTIFFFVVRKLKPDSSPIYEA